MSLVSEFTKDSTAAKMTITCLRYLVIREMCVFVSCMVFFGEITGEFGCLFGDRFTSSAVPKKYFLNCWSSFCHVSGFLKS